MALNDVIKNTNLVELEHERGNNDRDGAHSHRGRPHPGLKLESPGREASGCDGDADQVVDGGEDKVQPDPADRPP